MSESAEAVLELAAKLSLSERLDVYEALERGLGPPMRPVDEAMLDRRWAEIESGAVKCIPHEEVMRELRALLV